MALSRHRIRIWRGVILRLTLCLAAVSLAAPDAGAADSSMAVSATVLSKSVCRFAAGTALSLNFGAIDPSRTSDVVVSIPATFTCRGSEAVAVYSVSSNDGLYKSGAGAPRMRHGTVPTEFLAYTLNLPQNGSAPKNVPQTLTITGTLRPASFQNALAGTYSDTVVVTIAP